MNIILNKKEAALPDGMTVAELLKEKSIRKAAVWINGRQLLMSEYEQIQLQEGDDVKLLRILAGG